MNTNSIVEIITIYRKMKKGRTSQNIYRTLLDTPDEHYEAREFEQPYDGTKNVSVYDFARFRSLLDTKYIVYSTDNKLLQSDTLTPHLIELKNQKFFWINIFDPKEDDLRILAETFNVHDISLIDIRERNTEEKIEVFRHYTFVSLKLFSDTNWEESDDIDFNILMFKDFIITTHDKPWGGINDIINFMHLIETHTVLLPDWVFYSIIIEFLQDLKYITASINSAIENIKDVISANENNIEGILKRNFDLVYRIYLLRNTIKPKVEILQGLKSRCKKRMRKNVLNFLDDCYADFKKQASEIKEFNVILERSQDICLAIVDMLQSREGNAMNKTMEWFTMITFIFLPCQVISGLWGMNVIVPGQGGGSLMWFYILSFIVVILMYMSYLLYHKVSRQKRRLHKLSTPA